MNGSIPLPERWWKKIFSTILLGFVTGVRVYPVGSKGQSDDKQWGKLVFFLATYGIPLRKLYLWRGGYKIQVLSCGSILPQGKMNDV